MCPRALGHSILFSLLPGFQVPIACLSLKGMVCVAQGAGVKKVAKVYEGQKKKEDMPHRRPWD